METVSIYVQRMRERFDMHEFKKILWLCRRRVFIAKGRIEPRVFKRIDANDLTAIDKELIHGIKERGQSLRHLYVASSLLQSLCSERTIRRYIYKGYLSVRAHELPRYVRYKHKYDYAKKKIVNVERMLGRTHSDYLNYVKAYPDLSTWQYDSVEGKIDDRKAILTITLPSTRFQFAIWSAREAPGRLIIGYANFKRYQEANTRRSFQLT